MAYSNRPSMRGIPGLRPAYPANPDERLAVYAYTLNYMTNKREKKELHMKRTRQGLHGKVP